jgi:hypothetical protein
MITKTNSHTYRVKNIRTAGRPFCSNRSDCIRPVSCSSGSHRFQSELCNMSQHSRLTKPKSGLPRCTNCRLKPANNGAVVVGRSPEFPTAVLTALGAHLVPMSWQGHFSPRTFESPLFAQV